MKENMHACMQTWKLREEGRLLEIIDPELTEYPEGEVTRFIKVALFCTQAAPQKRPDMKQVIQMLSKEVILNENVLTEPGVYRLHSSRKLVSDSTQTSSSSHTHTTKHSPFTTLTQFDITQTLPR